MLHDYLHHLDSELISPDPLEQYASRASQSPAHFRRQFRNQFGEPPHRYLKESRLQWGALKLLLGETDIGSIARDSGFETLAAFSKAFKQRFGVAPSLYQTESDERIQKKLDQLPDGYSHDVQIEYRDAIAIASMRHTLPDDQDADGYERAWRLFLFKMGRNLFSRNVISVFDLSYDDTFLTSGGGCRFDTAMSLPDGFVPSKSISSKEIPAGFYASITLQGSIHDIDLAWHWFLFRWLRRSDHTLANFLGVTEVEI